jgi:hypothetical protein
MLTGLSVEPLFERSELRETLAWEHFKFKNSVGILSYNINFHPQLIYISL